MSTVSISEAIRMVGISRSHFYKKFVNTGLISIVVENNKKLIDVSELIRIFGNVVLKNSSQEQLNTGKNCIEIHEKDKIIKLLEQQLAEAKEREEWLKAQLEKATALIEDKTIKNRKKFLGIF